MARSLQVQPEENVTTSPLLWGFLAFASLWLLAGTVLAATADAEPPAGIVEGF